jgi:uncharacterized protein YhdP
VSLDLPPPWRKDSAERRPLHLLVALGAEGGPLQVELGDDLFLNLDLGQGGLSGAALGIGDRPDALEPNRLLVSGQVPLLQTDAWRRFITTYFPAGQTAVIAQEITDPAADPNAPFVGRAPAGLAIDIDDLRVGILEIGRQSVPDVVFSLQVDAGRRYLALETDWLQAEYLDESENDYASVVLKRLDLLGAQHLELRSASGESGGSYLQVPPTRVAIERLHRGDLELGNLAFRLHSEGAELMVTDLTGDIAGLQLGQPEPGRLVWRQEEPPFSSLRLGVGFADLGDTLARLGYEKIVETQAGNFNFELQWPDSPQAFSLQQGEIEGAVTVAIKEGRFLEAPSGASGALKVVNILNLADIVQRLSLSHMFESGIPFDNVKGEIFLHKRTIEDPGKIEVARMEVKGPSSFFFSGVSNIEQRSLDGELVATLPVADNLPWVAALTAGLPVAAGVYVVSKLLQKQVDQLSSAVYSISGSWDDPQVEFAHIFDSGGNRGNGASAPPRPAADARESVADHADASEGDGEPPDQFEP